MMQNQSDPIHSKLRLAGTFIILSLVIQVLSLLWNHPLSFIAFVTLGGLFLAIGIVLYLLTVVNMAANPMDGADADPDLPKAELPRTQA
jgi:predicted membrane channel-forming protein YqfA (hemolysin III family)